MAIENETEFLTKQQFLALQVARLPLLRNDLKEAEKQVANGFLGNAGRQRDEYNNCIRWIKDIVKEM